MQIPDAHSALAAQPTAGGFPAAVVAASGPGSRPGGAAVVGELLGAQGEENRSPPARVFSAAGLSNSADPKR